MRRMTKEEILNLGNLSRLKLTDSEAESFSQEVDAILDYVGVIEDITTAEDLSKKVGSVFNVFREDEVTNEPGEFTDKLVAEFPEKENNLLKVKKILNPDQ